MCGLLVRLQFFDAVFSGNGFASLTEPMRLARERQDGRDPTTDRLADRPAQVEDRGTGASKEVDDARGHRRQPDRRTTGRPVGIPEIPGIRHSR